jgi:hypothetical protein
VYQPIKIPGSVSQQVLTSKGSHPSYLPSSATLRHNLPHNNLIAAMIQKKINNFRSKELESIQTRRNLNEHH